MPAGRPKKSKDDEFDKEKQLRNISNLDSSIRSVLSEMSTMPDDMMAPSDLLPGLNFDYETYDYERDVETIKEDAKETLECISSLYLNKDIAKKKSVMRIIRDDAETISNIKFSLSCAKRGLIKCMQKLDAGSDDPLMHGAVNSYQKEIRDSSKMINDLMSKMKAFYKELRAEYERKEINEQSKITGGDTGGAPALSPTSINGEEGLVVFDSKVWNNIIDEYKSDPTLLGGAIFGTSATTTDK